MPSLSFSYLWKHLLMSLYQRPGADWKIHIDHVTKSTHYGVAQLCKMLFNPFIIWWSCSPALVCVLLRILLFSLIQNGSPKVLLSVVPGVWNDTSALMKSNTAARSPLLRKYLVKLTQRIGMICLPPRHQSWRYVVRLLIMQKMGLKCFTEWWLLCFKTRVVN